MFIMNFVVLHNRINKNHVFTSKISHSNCCCEVQSSVWSSAWSSADPHVPIVSAFSSE